MQLAGIGHAVLVGVDPDFQGIQGVGDVDDAVAVEIGEPVVACVDLAVMVAVERRQLRKAPSLRAAEHLAVVVDLAVAVEVAHQDAVVGVDPAHRRGKLVVVDVEDDAGAVPPRQRDAVAVEIEYQRVGAVQLPAVQRRTDLLQRLQHDGGGLEARRPDVAAPDLVMDVDHVEPGGAAGAVGAEIEAGNEGLVAARVEDHQVALLVAAIALAMDAIGVDALRTAPVNAARQRAAVIGDVVRSASVLEQQLTVVRCLDLVGPAAGLHDGAGPGGFYGIVAGAEVDRETGDRATDDVAPVAET